MRQGSLDRQLFLRQRLGQLLDRSRLIRRINNRFQRRFSLFVSHVCLAHGARRPSFRTEQAGAFSFRCAPAKRPACAVRNLSFLSLITSLLLSFDYLYSSSICLIPPLSSKTKSNILCFRTKISPNCFSCTSATACNFTISKTAMNATIIACREGQASKNWISFTAFSLLAT